MPIQLKEENGGKILAVHVSGRLAKADYEHFVPEFEWLVLQHGKLRVLFDMTGFHGWDASALWEDIKFDIKALRRHRTGGDDRGKDVAAGYGDLLQTAHESDHPVFRSR